MKIALFVLSLISIAWAEPPVPSTQYLPSNEYLPPQNEYLPPPSPRNEYLPPSNPPPPKYLPPATSYGTPSSTYGAPKPNYSAPRPTYGPPKSSYGPPKSTYGPPKSSYGPPSTSYGTPSSNYGAPSTNYGTPSSSYGAPNGGYQKGGYEYSEPANYEFEYHVQDAESGNDFGHKEQRQGDVAQGKYFVLLPDGRLQTVEYVADQNGYRPKISYQQVGNGGYGGGYSYGNNGGGY